MSGGHFDYQQYRIDAIAEKIFDEIRNNEEEYDYSSCEESYGFEEKETIIEKPEGWQRYPDDIIKEFKEGYRICNIS